MKKRSGRPAVLALVVWLCLTQSANATLEQEFQVQLKRGITFFFPAGPDEGVYMTLQGSKVMLRYLAGAKADGSLQNHVDEGSFSFANGKVTLHGSFLKRDIILKLRPLTTQTRRRDGTRFLLVSDEFPIGGRGPVDFRAATRVKKPSPSLELK